MRKTGFFIVLSIFCLALSTTDYLNPLYPVYAAAEVGPTAPKPPGPVQAVKRMEENREKLASKAADLRMKAEERRENVASQVAKLKDKMASREATLRAKLALFKDKVKATAVERINKSLGIVQTNRIAMMKKHLEQLTKVLDTIETRINEAAANGTNVDQAKTAISSARTALDNAVKAVDAENEKDYTVEVTSESTVKSDAKVSRDSLLADLKSTHELVRKAREAVQTALKAAKEALGVGASASASPVN